MRLQSLSVCNSPGPPPIWFAVFSLHYAPSPAECLKYFDAYLLTADIPIHLDTDISHYIVYNLQSTGLIKNWVKYMVFWDREQYCHIVMCPIN